MYLYDILGQHILARLRLRGTYSFYFLYSQMQTKPPPPQQHQQLQTKKKNFELITNQNSNYNFGYLIMAKLRWLYIFLPNTQNTIVILQSLTLYALRSPLHPSFPPSSFSFILVSHTSPCLVFLVFYNPLHIVIARASSHTPRCRFTSQLASLLPASAAYYYV
jgi:hypothetical protein